MAFTAREVIMTFRGQNYLSGAIRRIGYDVGGLSRTAQLANQRAALQNRASQLQYARATAQQELYSVTRGQRQLALAQARSSLSRTEANAVERVHHVETQRLRNMRDMNVAQAQNARLIEAQAAAQGAAISAAAKRGKKLTDEQIAQVSTTSFVGRGTQRQTISEAMKINELDLQRLQGEAGRLAEAYATANITMSQMGSRAQQVAAQDAALVQREAQLQQVIMARTRAIDENRIAQIANNFEATKVAPVQIWEQRAASIEHAGRAMSMFGLIATAAMGFAATSAAKFNQQFTLAATQARPPGAGANVTAQKAVDIQKRVMGMMQEFPASASEMADSFYQIFSGTNIQNVKVASDAVKVFNQMAVAGSADLKSMTDAGITMYNNFGGLHGEFKDLTQAGDAFFATVRYGRMNAQQFADALPMVAAQAKMVGLSFNDIAGAMATLTRQTGGKLTSRDATGLARLIEIFARPDFQAGAKKFGVSVKDDITGNMRPLLDIIDEFSQKTKGKARIDMLSMFKEISAMGSASGRGGTLGTIQARRAFAYLITNIDKYRNVSHLVRTDNNELQKSFEAMAKTPGVEWSVFLNRLKVLIYTIGTQAIPAFMALGRPLARAVQWFNGLSDHTKSLIGTWGTFISVGMLVVGVIAAMGGGVARLVAQFYILRRMKALEGIIATERAAQAIAPPVGGGMVYLPGGAVASRTQQSIDAEEAARRQRSMPRAGGITAVGAGVGLAALVGLPILAQQSKTIDNIINKLGGMNTAMLTVIGTMALMTFRPQLASAAQWVIANTVGAVRVSTAWTVSAARSSTAWVVSNARSITSMEALAAAGRTAAVTIATGFRVAAIAAATALRSILVAAGWTALLIAVSYAVSYIITHWSKVKEWFGVFWRYMKATSAAAWQAMIETGKSAVYIVLRMVLTSIEAILKVATFIPGIRGSAKAALRDIEGLINRFKPDYGKVGKAFTGTLDADARARAAKAAQDAEDKAARKAENDRSKALQAYWEKRQAYERASKRNAALDKIVGVTSGTSAQGTVQSWINAVIKARQYMDAHPYDVAAAQTYETIIKQLNERFKDQPQLLAAINDVLQQYTSNIDKASKATQKQQITMEQMVQGVQSLYNNFLQQNQSFMGELNQGPWIQSLDKLDWGGRITAYDQTRDLRSRITQFKNFRGLLEKLRAEGAPPQLIQEFMNKGVGSIDELRTLTRMSKPELDRYFGMIRTAQKLVHQATMQDLRRQLNEYKTYGRQAALNIIAGVTSETPALERALKKMITSAFGKIPTEAQIAAQNAAAQVSGTGGGGGAGTITGTGTATKGVKPTPVKPIKPAQWVDPSAGRVRYVQHIMLPPAQLAEVQRVATRWIGNSKKLDAIIHQYGKEPITQAKWADIYGDLEKEIRREFRKQKLPQLNELQLEKLIRIVFGFMPPLPIQSNKVPHVTTAQPGMAWVPNMDRLKNFLRFFNMPDWARSQIKPQDTLKMYRQLIAEIRREIRAQGLKMPTDKALEKLIQQRFHIKPAPGWQTQQRQTQGAGTTNNYKYEIVAPKSEHATVQAQIRHGDFVIRNRHKPGR